jgi:hypothetical protein
MIKRRTDYTMWVTADLSGMDRDPRPYAPFDGDLLIVRFETGDEVIEYRANQHILGDTRWNQDQRPVPAILPITAFPGHFRSRKCSAKRPIQRRSHQNAIRIGPTPHPESFDIHTKDRLM